jgi:uncharacterized membrane protein YphA (DoxX/SURF4 family)
MVSAVLLVLRLVLAAVFLVSGIAKLGSRDGSHAAAGALGVPPRVAAVVGSALPVVEIVLGALLIVTPSGRAAAGAAAVVLLAFSILIAVNLARGRRPVCHCFGAFSRSPISLLTLLRNVALFAAAVVVALRGGGRDLLDLV